MNYKRTLAIVFLFLTLTENVLADDQPVDCARRSLASVISAEHNKSISFTGTCSGPIVIKTDGLTLTGVGNAIIDGSGKDAVTVAGAHGVTLANFKVQNGINGITGTNGAHFNLSNIEVHDSFVFGITLQLASSALLSGVTTNKNGLHGLDLETGSAVTITGQFTSSNNKVFGINVNGSSLTFSQADASANGNTLGIQVATNSNAFINDSKTVVTVSDNLATGLTIVSGGHMVSFGGTIRANSNPLNGVSLNSKGGLDLDAGSLLECDNNGDGLLLQENSVMTVFNIPQFSGFNGFSTVNCSGNSGNGVVVRNGSTLTVSNQAKVNSTQNSQVGILADNGAGVTLVNSTINGNTVKDTKLNFDSRADISTSDVGSLSCDATVLIRGTTNFTCPR
jgi:hypothetical protein